MRKRTTWESAAFATQRSRVRVPLDPPRKKTILIQFKNGLLSLAESKGFALFQIAWFITQTLRFRYRFHHHSLQNNSQDCFAQRSCLRVRIPIIKNCNTQKGITVFWRRARDSRFFKSRGSSPKPCGFGTDFTTTRYKTIHRIVLLNARACGFESLS